jgi:hypothetical protein
MLLDHRGSLRTPERVLLTALEEVKAALDETHAELRVREVEEGGQILPPVEDLEVIRTEAGRRDPS